MFRMEGKFVSRRFRKYNPKGVVVPTTAKQKPHVKPFDFAQARRGAKYNRIIPSTGLGAKQLDSLSS